MFRMLSPHPEYRESGVVWLPTVPAHWETRRLKTIVKEKNLRGFPDEPLLAATQSRGVIRKADYGIRTVEAQKSLETLKLVDVNDFVISLRSFQGGIERAYARGIISPAYTILQARHGSNRDYLTYLFKSREFVDALKLTVTGIREGQNIEYARLARDLVPVPPADEQAAIVKYLGHAHARIDHAIAAKRKLVTLLEEQTQAVIHEAVTRGLDPDVPLRDSGIRWLGPIPAHWESSKLGWHVQLTTGFPFSSNAFTAERFATRLLRGVNVNPGKLNWAETVRLPVDQVAVFSEYELAAGDIVIGMDRPIVKSGTRVARVTDADTPSLLVQRVARLRTAPNLNTDYLFAFLAGPSFRQYLTPLFTGISVPHLSPAQIKDFRIPLPPVQEQQAIADRIRSETEGFESVASRAVREMELLREFRTRLTSDVVTGQVDVREIAATLPELSDDILANTSDEAVDTDAEDFEELTEGEDD